MGKRKVVVLLVLLLAVPGAVAAPDKPAPSRTVILDRAVELARKEALNASRVDWPATIDVAKKILQQDNTEVGLAASIRFVLGKLQDRHSFYRPPISQSAGSSPAIPQQPKPIAKASSTPGNVPVLTVVSWAGRDMGSATATVRNELVSALAQRPCGIVVDFSSNPGGNMWPMVMGILPLYTDGMLGAFEGRDGRKSSIVSTGDGLLFDDSPHFLSRLALAQPTARPAYIAVVIGPRTASSGEITALLFKGQPNAKFFGQKSAGVPTANRTFTLENGALLGITTAVTLDRNGNRYDGPLVPDVETREPHAAAEEWLKGVCPLT